MLTTSIMLLFSIAIIYHPGYVIIPDGPAIFSQYGPWIDNGKMYYCRNSNHGGWYADRIWEADYSDGEATNQKIILQGSPDRGADDFLSCTGSVINNHIYYMTSAGDMTNLGVSHAQHNGGDWVKTGRIAGIANGAWIDTPSVVEINSRYYLYLVENERLTRYEIGNDWKSVKNRMLVSKASAIHGTVKKHGGKYYYVYADGDKIPGAIYLSESYDPGYFGKGELLFAAKSGWDRNSVFTPFLEIIDDSLIVYYAGNTKNIFWWGQDGSIGVRFIGK